VKRGNRGSGGVVEVGERGGMVKKEEYVGAKGISTHMMTNLNNSEKLFSGCFLFCRDFRVEHRDNKVFLMSSMKWLLLAKWGWRSARAVSRLSNSVIYILRSQYIAFYFMDFHRVYCRPVQA